MPGVFMSTAGRATYGYDKAQATSLYETCIPARSHEIWTAPGMPILESFHI